MPNNKEQQSIHYELSGIENNYSLKIKDSNNETIIKAQIHLLNLDETRKLKNTIINFLKIIGFD